MFGNKKITDNEKTVDDVKKLLIMVKEKNEERTV
jgi:hypothetical protein